jgi:hypothetical protein
VCFVHVIEGHCTVEAVDIHVERHGSSFGRDMYMTVGVNELLDHEG